MEKHFKANSTCAHGLTVHVNRFLNGSLTLVGSEGVGDVFIHGLQSSRAIQFVCVYRERLLYIRGCL
jgi:hypothetical protein